MTQHILVVGAGIGGMATALVLSRSGFAVTVLEQARAFGEVGAGVQLSPNTFGVLAGWGLTDALRRTANFPQHLQVRQAATHRLIGQLELGGANGTGGRARTRYGFDYATIHRADLHHLLLQAVRQEPHVTLHVNAKLESISEAGEQVQVTTERGDVFTADAMIGADGLWSRVRQHLFANTALDTPPRVTGHLAWRGLLPMDQAPAELRLGHINVWLSPHMHVVAYPVRQSQCLNVVVTHDLLLADAVSASTSSPSGRAFEQQSWSQDCAGQNPLHYIASLLNHSRSSHRDRGKGAQTGSGVLLQLVQTITERSAWTRWSLFDRAPLRCAQEMAPRAHPRMALLGDAAHPMLPYLAQGAAMAIEDAQGLGLAIERARQAGSSNSPEKAWAQSSVNLPAVLQDYAQTRWQRNARVQAGAQRNGIIFHAAAPLSWARDASIRLLGHRVLDTPWLYRGQFQPGAANSA